MSKKATNDYSGYEYLIKKNEKMVLYQSCPK